METKVKPPVTRKLLPENLQFSNTNSNSATIAARKIYFRKIVLTARARASASFCVPIVMRK